MKIKILLLATCLLFVSCNYDIELKGQAFRKDRKISASEVLIYTDSSFQEYLKKKSSEFEKAYNNNESLENLHFLTFQDFPITTNITTTDSDGRFSIKLPKGVYYLVIKSVWIIKINLYNPKTVILSDQNEIDFNNSNFISNIPIVP